MVQSIEPHTVSRTEYNAHSISLHASQKLLGVVQEVYQQYHGLMILVFPECERILWAQSCVVQFA